MSPIYDTLAVATESMERERGARLPCGPRANRHRAVANALLRLSGEEEWGLDRDDLEAGRECCCVCSLDDEYDPYLRGRAQN